jgi:hypothetical protein
MVKQVSVERLSGNPVITPASSPSIGTNINGPSVIRVPDWIDNPLGRYYMYFAHHKGKSIRLAFADHVEGPWTVHEPGALALEDSLYPTIMSEELIRPAILDRLTKNGQTIEALYTHIASPDVIVIPEGREFRLYYHGMLESGIQASRVAVSDDGLNFNPLPDIIARPYLRMFRWQDWHYGMAMPGVFYRSRDGLIGFEEGPSLFNPDMRHAALAIRDETLYVFWTQVGDNPERILLSTIDVSNDWSSWQASDPTDILAPEADWEGARLPAVASVRGAIEKPANQLRDPAIYEESGRTWLFYSVAGESGIAVARMEIKPNHD